MKVEIQTIRRMGCIDYAVIVMTGRHQFTDYTTSSLNAAIIQRNILAQKMNDDRVSGCLVSFTLNDSGEWVQCLDSEATGEYDTTYFAMGDDCIELPDRLHWRWVYYNDQWQVARVSPRDVFGETTLTMLGTISYFEDVERVNQFSPHIKAIGNEVNPPNLGVPTIED